MEQSEAVKKYLENLGVKFKVYKHPPVYTVEQADRYNQEIKGIHSKNLFLKSKQKRFFLVILPGEKRIDIRALEKLLNEKLKFASESDLFNILKITPGSVSPFALLNDNENKVELLIDKMVWESDFVSFHPGVNTETLELLGEDFHKFVESLEKKVLVIEH